MDAAGYFNWQRYSFDDDGWEQWYVQTASTHIAVNASWNDERGPGGYSHYTDYATGCSVSEFTDANGTTIIDSCAP